MSELVTPETDEAFQQWRREHPAGYIINAPRAGEGEMLWNQSQCPHLYGKYEDFGSYIRKTKACATNPAELALWATLRPNPLT